MTENGKKCILINILIFVYTPIAMAVKSAKVRKSAKEVVLLQKKEKKENAEITVMLADVTQQ